ncbi:MAG: SUMF1/EgtB/PvdO family nonheme iron enzyme, partial [bacterium]|nr:SUMF1/EgtB/PvdO family nonheme iron enzyme [bacterium]
AYYTSEVWKLPGFAEAVLDDFHLGQVLEFLRRWYGCVGPLHGIENHETCLERAEGMFRDIQHNSQLQELAKRPLLLTQMACLHLASNSKLPEKRVELYQQTVDLLLDRWELKKIIRTTTQGKTQTNIESLFEILGLKKDKVLHFLEKLAYQAHKTQTPGQKEAALIDEGDLLKGLSRLSEAADIDQRIIKTHLRDRAGILLSPGSELYTFPHRSFQEYLTACYWARQDTPEFSSLDDVAALSLEDPLRWQEVMLLFGATQFGSWGFWPLIEALCPYETTEGETHPQYAWGALWGGQILLENHVEIAQLGDSNTRKLRRIADWLVAIVSEQAPMILPQNEAAPFPIDERSFAGNMLARLGDPRPGVGLREDGLPEIEWCEAPEGDFVMGSDKSVDKKAYPDEEPQHSVTLSTFHLSRYPVTNAQYQAFVTDGGYTEKWRKCWSEEGWKWKEEEEEEAVMGPEPYGNLFDIANHPVVGISWYEAQAYCCWLTEFLWNSGDLQETQEIRLPSEAEWEKAARGTDGRIFPWSNTDITPELANYSNTELGATSAVGCFSKNVSPYGCEEMSGNVFEWCADWFTDKYYAKSPAENPTGPASGSSRVIRGGAWYNVAGDCRAAYRCRVDPGNRYDHFGFRLLRTPL